MNKPEYYLILVSLFFSRCLSFAQLPDGVSGTSSYLDEIVKNYDDENALSFDIKSTPISARIPLRVHVIMNIEGLAGVNSLEIYNNVNNASNYFNALGIHFYVDSVDFINDYNYSYITYDKNRTELLTKHAVSNKINLFMADSIKMGTNLSYGFTYFPIVTDSNFIFINKNNFSGNSLAAMLGHFMGLLSTHETGRGAELASEKNCGTSGDFICDTYADPDLLSQVADTCEYTGSMRDSEGKYYVPSVANIMSNSLDNCKCIFTPLQYRRMYYYYLKYRQNLSVE
jgi:hypothetical protein